MLREVGWHTSQTIVSIIADSELGSSDFEAFCALPPHGFDEAQGCFARRSRKRIACPEVMELPANCLGVGNFAGDIQRLKLVSEKWLKHDSNASDWLCEIGVAP